MDQSMLGFMIEGMVSLLLLATIFYCISLSRKLERLRREQKEMRSYIGELLAATGNAEKAIRSLRSAADEAGGELSAQIEHSRQMKDALKKQIDAAGEAMNKLMVMTTSAAQRLTASPSSASPAPLQPASPSPRPMSRRATIRTTWLSTQPGMRCRDETAPAQRPQSGQPQRRVRDRFRCCFC